MMCYAQSAANGHIRAKQHLFLPQVKGLIHDLIHIPPLKSRINLEKMKLNEPGRQTLGPHRNPAGTASKLTF